MVLVNCSLSSLGGTLLPIMLSVFHTYWYCRRVTQKTGRLTSAEVGRLTHLGGSGPHFDTGRVTVNYLDPSSDDPVAGHGTHYSVTLDGPELVEFTMRRPTEASPRLTRRLVRDAPVDAIAELARRESMSDGQAAMNQYLLDLEGIPFTQQDGSVVPFRMDGVRRFANTAWSEFKRPGRAGRPDVEYAALAAEYIQECREHGGRGAAISVADRHGLSPATMRNLLHEATRRGLKTKAAPGMAGGDLTQKAIDLLSQSTA